jgi:hypothetical protein
MVLPAAGIDGTAGLKVAAPATTTAPTWTWHAALFVEGVGT